MHRTDEDRLPSLTAFSIYLRTGRRLPGDVEVKFNPWHDPDNGRFTFVGRGRYFPPGSRNADQLGSEFRGRGGRFGGGGASASWAPRPQPFQPASRSPSRVVARSKAARQSEAPRLPERRSRGVLVSAHEARLAAEEPLLSIEKNGYQFQVDAHVRARRASGQLQLGSTERRSRRAQAQAGGKDRRSTDDGGHYIGARFNGPRDAFNHFAQDASFNRGGYRALEDNWAKSIRAGHKVFVDIIPHYTGDSQRPDGIDIFYFIDDKRYETYFPNGKGKK